MERLMTIRWAKAFSLVEAMLATAVLGIAAAGVLLPFSGGAAIRAEGMHRTLGAKLASDLIEQVVSTPFDQVISTCNYTETTGQVKNSSGVVFTNSIYAKYSRKVESIAVCVPQDAAAAATYFIRTTVTVYYNDAKVAEVSRLLGKY
jgi:type II secretory pathway pseudopilin PulG